MFLAVLWLEKIALFIEDTKRALEKFKVVDKLGQSKPRQLDEYVFEEGSGKI